MLTKDEIKKLSSKDLKEYSKADEAGKQLFALSWREENAEKKETRGRHKKDCNCEKCVKNRELKNNLLNEKESETGNRNGNNNEGSQNIEQHEGDKIQNEEKKEGVETSNEGFETAKELTTEQKLEDELNQFKKSHEENSNSGGSSNSNNGSSGSNGNASGNSNLQSPVVAQTVDVTMFVTASAFLTALDYLFPIILKFVVGQFNAQYRRMNQNAVEKLRLSDGEKKSLEPSADAVVRYLFAQANPIVAFFVMYAMIQGGKFLMLDADKDFFPPKQKTDKEIKKEKFFKEDK